MIKCNLKKDEESIIEIEGSLTDNLADLAFIIHAMHVLLSNSNIFMGRMFERFLKNPEFWDQVFKPSPEDEYIIKASKREGE